jgi:hypothetical protein
MPMLTTILIRLTQYLLNIIEHFIAATFIKILVMWLEKRASMKRYNELTLGVSHYFSEIIDNVVKRYEE